jgi:hypothetical protein
MLIFGQFSYCLFAMVTFPLVECPFQAFIHALELTNNFDYEKGVSPIYSHAVFIDHGARSDLTYYRHLSPISLEILGPEAHIPATL